jgi:protein ImuB
VVRADRVQACVSELADALSTFSPRVETEPLFEGAFLVDPTGLEGLYGGLVPWARAVHEYLTGRGLRASVVVGFSRYHALAIARRSRGARVIPSAAAEQAEAGRVSLRELGAPARLCADLAKLGVRSVAELEALPAGELADRFGAEAARLHGLFASGPQLPMQPRAIEEPVEATFEVEPPDDDVNRLLFAIKGGLHDLLRSLSRRGEQLAALRLTLELESAPAHEERLEPAAPTSDALVMLELVRLRLSNARLAAPVERVRLQADSLRVRAEQLATVTERPRRDLGAARRALARVRAAYGADSVNVARLRDAHLPEARFRWEPAADVNPARSRRRATQSPLVRRVLAKPRPLSPKESGDPERGPRLDPAEGAVSHLYGPYRVSGGWWVRAVERDYYYAETDAGSVLWVFFDRPRQRWFLHGYVD